MSSIKSYDEEALGELIEDLHMLVATATPYIHEGYRAPLEEIADAMRDRFSELTRTLGRLDPTEPAELG